MTTDLPPQDPRTVLARTEFPGTGTSLLEQAERRFWEGCGHCPSSGTGGEAAQGTRQPVSQEPKEVTWHPPTPSPACMKVLSHHLFLLCGATLTAQVFNYLSSWRTTKIVNLKYEIQSSFIFFMNCTILPEPLDPLVSEKHPTPTPAALSGMWAGGSAGAAALSSVDDKASA